MVQIRLESLFSVQCPTPTIGMDKGGNIETISMATILQRVVRLGVAGNVIVHTTMGPVHR